MSDWFEQQAYSGSLLLAVPVAAIAGLVSFFSPCVIPLLPGYLSYATGLSGADLADARRWRMLAGAVLFVLGFAVVFVAIGTAAGSLGSFFIEQRRTFTVILGVLTIVLGLMFAGWLPGPQRAWRIHAVPAVGLAAAPLLGFLFGLGWTPCVGPTLGVITTLSINEGTAGRGALLSGVYALGLGLPFIVAALAYRKAMGVFAAIRRHQVAITRTGGVLLIVVGVAMVTGLWDYAVQWLQVRAVNTFEPAV